MEPIAALALRAKAGGSATVYVLDPALGPVGQPRYRRELAARVTGDRPTVVATPIATRATAATADRAAPRRAPARLPGSPRDAWRARAGTTRRAPPGALAPVVGRHALHCEGHSRDGQRLTRNRRADDAHGTLAPSSPLSRSSSSWSTLATRFEHQVGGERRSVGGEAQIELDRRRSGRARTRNLRSLAASVVVGVPLDELHDDELGRADLAPRRRY